MIALHVQDGERSYGQACPLARTLDLLGERWTMLILRDLFLGSTRFSQFLERSPGMPSRMLSARLKKLERCGFVERVIYSEHPLRAEYRLTRLGESVRPVVSALASWGMEHTMRGRERASIAQRLRAHGVVL